MLVNEVIDSKSIALSATENASNQIPYLGLQWFPERKKQGLDLQWIKTHKGLPVSLAPSNFDSIPTIRAREGLSKEKTQMAFFREGMTIGEAEMLEIERANTADDPYLASALSAVYDDTSRLVSGAEVVPERMRMDIQLSLLRATVFSTPMIMILTDHTLRIITSNLMEQACGATQKIQSRLQTLTMQERSYKSKARLLDMCL